MANPLIVDSTNGYSTASAGLSDMDSNPNGRRMLVDLPGDQYDVYWPESARQVAMLVGVAVVTIYVIRKSGFRFSLAVGGR